MSSRLLFGVIPEKIHCQITVEVDQEEENEILVPIESLSEEEARRIAKAWKNFRKRQ
jgi:hypothetical protein